MRLTIAIAATVALAGCAGNKPAASNLQARAAGSVVSLFLIATHTKRADRCALGVDVSKVKANWLLEEALKGNNSRQLMVLSQGFDELRAKPSEKTDKCTAETSAQTRAFLKRYTTGPSLSERTQDRINALRKATAAAP